MQYPFSYNPTSPCTCVLLLLHLYCHLYYKSENSSDVAVSTCDVYIFLELKLRNAGHFYK